MQCCAPRSKTLARVFGRTRAGTRVDGARCSTAATCVCPITRGGAVFVHVVGEADHVDDSTCVGAGRLKREIPQLGREIRASGRGHVVHSRPFR
jgi:hypothetical protein